MNIPRLKSLTLGHRIYLLSGLLCLSLAGLGTFAITRLIDLRETTNDIVNDSLPGLVSAGRINANQAESQLRILRLILAKTPEEKAALRAEIDAITKDNQDALAKYEASVHEEEDRQNFAQLQARRATYQAERTRFYQLLETDHDAAQKQATHDLRQAYQAYTKAGDVLADYNSRIGTERGQELSTRVRSDIRVVTIAGGAAVLAGVLLSLFFVRQINRALGVAVEGVAAGSEQITAASGQVASSAQSLAAGASEQAASIEETSASLEEMSSMTKNNAENAQQAKITAAQTRQLADRGATQMVAMEQAMQGIQTASTDIAKILKTIDEIAFQTNILALNAAVEAARAGEAGAGFAVVADEVRALAQRCATAAKETAGKIEESVNQSRNGVTISAEVARSFSDIQAHVRQLDQLVAEIAHASQEQHQGIQQVSSAVTQMDRVTQTNAGNAEESAAAAEELNAQAATLNEVVASLQQLAGAVAARPAADRTPTPPPAPEENHGRDHPTSPGSRLLTPTTPLAHPPANSRAARSFAT